MTDHSDVRVPERRVKQILARAIELDDQHSHGVSVSEIRVMAAEIGVSAAAIETAIAEAVETSESTDIAQPTSWRLPLVATGYGLLLGTAAGTLFAFRLTGQSADWLVGSTFAALQISGVALAAAVERDHRHFQTCNFGMWAGAAAGAAVGASAAHLAGAAPLAYTLSSVLAWIGRGWLLSAIIGSGALILRSARRRAGVDAGRSSALRAGVLKVRRRLAAFLHRIADRLSETRLRSRLLATRCSHIARKIPTRREIASTR